MELNQESTAKFTFAGAPNEQGAVVVRLGGEIDLSNVDQLRPKLEQALSDHPQRIIIDLSDLTFFDSSGIAILVEMSEKVPTLELRHASTLIQRIIEATGLKEVLKVLP